jgi:hypothetical protein
MLCLLCFPLYKNLRGVGFCFENLTLQNIIAAYRNNISQVTFIPLPLSLQKQVDLQSLLTCPTSIFSSRLTVLVLL